MYWKTMSDREPTRWQHNRIYPHPINPCVYTYDSRLYCCETQLADCHSELCPQDTNCVRPITAVKHPLHENSPNI